MRKPEIILVTLTNGDVALFVNSDAVMTLEAPERKLPPLAIVAEYLVKSLGVDLQSITMDTPEDEEWSWNDVYDLVPRAPDADTSLPIDEICARLLDSEEHATESAIPQVAEDAVEILRELNAELGRLEAANQNLVSERDEAVGLVSILYAALNDASSVVDRSDGETYSYQAELESARAFMGIADNPAHAGSTDATVEEYSMDARLAPEPLEEDELADFMRQRIDNGEWDLEDDIPVRLARFGMMYPSAFEAEMRERMQMAKEDSE